MPSQILMIDCPDRMGLVHHITKVIYDHHLNIIGNQEFVDPVSKHFFMRTVVEGNGLNGQIESELAHVLPRSANIRITRINKKPIVILATKEPHCLGDLLLRNVYGELPSDVQAVISNHDDLRPLAESFNIPFHHVPVADCSREEHEQKLLECIESHQPEIIVLAKYMRVFTPRFISKYPDRIVNIHHSFLPAFVGASPYKQAYERGVKIIGATAHFVTEDLDDGPIIAQNVIPVDHSYTAEEMAQAGRDVEKIVLAKALKMVLEERVFIFKDRTILFE